MTLKGKTCSLRLEVSLFIFTLRVERVQLERCSLRQEDYCVSHAACHGGEEILHIFSEAVLEVYLGMKRGDKTQFIV